MSITHCLPPDELQVNYTSCVSSEQDRVKLQEMLHNKEELLFNNFKQRREKTVTDVQLELLECNRTVGADLEMLPLGPEGQRDVEHRTCPCKSAN